jgi:hypothetical protein
MKFIPLVSVTLGALFIGVIAVLVVHVRHAQKEGMGAAASNISVLVSDMQQPADVQRLLSNTSEKKLVEQSAEELRNFGLSQDEVNTLRTWPGPYMVEKDYNQRAIRIGMICLNHKLTKGALIRLIGPCSHADAHHMLYNIAPSEVITFYFDDTDKITSAYIANRKIKPDGTLE